jgi:hypothetical protein
MAEVGWVTLSAAKSALTLATTSSAKVDLPDAGTPAIATKSRSPTALLVLELLYEIAGEVFCSAIHGAWG